MKPIWKRCMVFLLILVMVLGMIPIANAAQIEPSQPPEETASPETITQTEEPTTETTVPTVLEETLAEETIPFIAGNVESSIALLADAEIVGAPNAFANLTLQNGGIDIPAQGYIQHKNILPLYSLYLTNQPGYANNYYVAYCIEPGVELGNSGGHYGTSYTIDSMEDGSGALYRLNRDQVEAIGVALLYGQREIASKKDEQSLRYQKLCRHAATQAIVWEIACGWRSPYPPYTLYDSTLYDAIKPALYCASAVWGTTFYLDGMDDAYLEIAGKMAQHYTIPSFASSSRSGAPAYTMIPNGSGTYSISLTDNNGILSQYTFTNTSQLTFSRSGNTLTITSNGPIPETVVTAYKTVPSLDDQVFYVWEKWEQQKLMSCKTPEVQAQEAVYFTLNVPDLTSTLNLTKTTEDGKNLAGWQFGIYADQNCTSLISGPHTTDVNGTLSVPGMDAGTVYVKELGNADPTISGLYTCAGANPQRVTLVPGETATVSFHNKRNTGSVQLIKTTNTGKNLNGWKIGLYTDAACTQPIAGSPFTTGADGTVLVPDLAPGTLYAKEIPVEDAYWVCDSTVKPVQIIPNQTASVAFTNTHYGNLRIRKNAINGSPEGWNFQILDAAQKVIATLKTDADGYAYSDMLLPGQYTVRELHDRDETYWEYDAAVEKQVTVTAGAQAEVSYTNTQYGKIQIQKSMASEGSVQGWKFRIMDATGAEIPGSPFTTDARGLILTGKLQPGTYTVEELIPEDSLYHCTSENPQTVTVKAGETAQVTFTNALRPGKITIRKVDSRGEPLARATFLLEWSEDGAVWQRVVYTDSSVVTKGCCFNSDSPDGTLTSGDDGYLEWTGLHPGLLYRVTELEAPEGYSLLTEPAFEGRLPADQLSLSFRVVNCEIFKLPETGGTSAALFQAARFACMVICGVMLTVSYRKERRK